MTLEFDSSQMTPEQKHRLNGRLEGPLKQEAERRLRTLMQNQIRKQKERFDTLGSALRRLGKTKDKSGR